ncbi:hypothetical protein [Fodinicurvata halophila]|uniref:hypothetical protein n=1 Tax=Fodinicurvata halophila TaxID=1419723 RepID=UPI003625EA0B
MERQYPSEKQVEAYQKAVEEQKSSMPGIADSKGAMLESNLPDVTEAIGEVDKAISTMDHNGKLGEGLSLVA